MDQIANVVVIAVIFAITGWMLKMWLAHQEKMKGIGMTKQGSALSDQRLERVEQAVESIAVEVERISEGQRYVTKLMSERAKPLPDGVPAQARAMDTPR